MKIVCGQCIQQLGSTLAKDLPYCISPSRWTASQVSLSKFAKDAVSHGASRSLRQRLEAVLHWLPLAAGQPEQNVEYVHQLRVSTRRAGAALQLFTELLPKKRVKRLKSLLKQIRSSAGDARDDDVFLARLTVLAADQPALDPLIQQLREHRAATQAQLVQIWRKMTNNGHQANQRKPRKRDSSGLQIDAFVARVRWRSKDAEPSFHQAAVRWLRPIAQEFFDAQPGPESPPEKLHEFRIAGKHLRYALDLLAPGFSGRAVKKTIKRVSKLQDRLGCINDHATAIERLERWLTQDHSADLKSVLSSQLDEERAALKSSCEEFHCWWTEAKAAKLRDQLSALIE